MTKNELQSVEEKNYIKIIDQSGVETAIENLVQKNNALLLEGVAVERIKNSAGFYISNREDLMTLEKSGKLTMLYGVLKEAMVGCEAGTDYDIVPFKGKPVIIRNKNGWFKIIDMVKPAEIVRFTSNVVFKGDEFSWNPVTEEVKHIPKTSSDKYEDITHSYAYIKFANGFEKTVVMTKKDLDNIKKVSPSSSSSFSPWNSQPVKMVKTKTVKELAKELFTLYSGRLNPILNQAIDSDEQVVTRVDERGFVENDKTIYEAKAEEKPNEEAKTIKFSELEE